MPLEINKKREKMENKDISTIKSAVHAPSFGNSPEGIPPGLEDAPSPTSQEKKKEKNEGGVPIQQMTPQSQPAMQSAQQIQPEKTQIMPPSGIVNPVEAITEPSAERASFDVIEEIAESIISEKWDDLVKNVGDLKLWKERIDTDVEGIKQEIIRTQTRLENLQTAVMGKVSEYGEGVTDISAELKALEKVMEKIINPLTKSVKDLQKVTDRIKR
tara:strand:+ start:706 stop:1350 length:645 start_codon:yes stop_codon:yes gene_type:complete